MTTQLKPSAAVGAAAATGDHDIKQVAHIDQTVRAYVARHNTIEARVERIAQALAGLSQRDRDQVLAAARKRAAHGAIR